MSLKSLCPALLGLLATSLAWGHHSFFGRFDTDSSMELRGTVKDVHWRNPHIHIILEVADGSTWDLESGSPTLMQRAGIPRGAIKAGQEVVVAAYPPVTDKQEAFATNVLLPDGRELVLQTGAGPRFKKQVLGDFSYRFRTEGDRSKPELGLFRIWTFTGADGFLFPESIDRDYDLNNYPMTAAAQAKLAAFNPATDNPTNNCTPKGMPTIMEQPLPMEVRREGEDIVLIIEEYDLRRRIHMNPDKLNPSPSFSPLGYSVGRWEEDTLVVLTDRINWPHFNQAGIPLSPDVSIEERFSVVEEGSEMNYQMRITDPVYFSRPVTLSKKWIYVPGVEILPFECSELDAASKQD